MRDNRRFLGPVSDPGPLLALATFALAFVGLGVVWLGGSLGAWLSGAGWQPPRFGPGMVILLLRGVPLWPGADSGWVAAGILTLALLVVAAASPVAVWALRRWQSAHPGLATRAHVQHLTTAALISEARRLRRSLKDRPASDLSGPDVGILLGRLAGTRLELRASYENVGVIIAGPRVGKTSRLVANPVLDAVGPCIVTSVRPDVYTITAHHRQRRDSRIWLFDPQNITHGEQDMWWDILSMARTLEGARRLAGHLTRSMGKSHHGDGEFFTAAGRSTLTNLLHAAALDGRPLAEMLNWTSDQRDRTAVYILRRHGLLAMSNALERMTKLAQETQDGVYEHVRQAVASLYDPAIAAWVTPQPGAEKFDPAAFVESTDTLYMLSKEGGGGASGILAALTDACLDAGVRLAEASRGGRMDPPMLAMLDEAANICRIEDLPNKYSIFGGFGINVLTVLQSYDQGVDAWGQEGMKKLWGASTIKLLGAGMDDYRFLDELSHLVGMRAIVEQSLTTSRGGTSHTRSRRRERIIDAAEIRELDKKQALLLATATRPALVDLQAWYERPDADQLQADKDELERRIEERAAAKREGHR